MIDFSKRKPNFKANPFQYEESKADSIPHGFGEEGGERGEGEGETRRQGDKETRRQGDKETRRQGVKE
ncbi:hypothetical protein [Roseimaritima multifibrata]|uniref:hypothetical protein n=1 Tax=Roseimaritima multifibrata TaxID=1930274 RepID=UPI001C54C20E|nr:hypothetical protein [Roseimaritima multifibrata]